MIGEKNRRRQGRVLIETTLRHNPAGGLCEGVAAGARPPRPNRTPRAALRENDLRIDFLEILETEAEPLQHARTIVGQNDVGDPGEAPNDLDAVGLLQVHRDTALAAIHRDEVMRDLRVLHVGAADELGEHPAA